MIVEILEQHIIQMLVAHRRGQTVVDSLNFCCGPCCVATHVEIDVREVGEGSAASVPQIFVGCGCGVFDELIATSVVFGNAGEPTGLTA